MNAHAPGAQRGRQRIRDAQQQHILRLLDGMAGVVPSVRLLTDMAGLMPATVDKHLQRLEEAGFIKPRSRRDAPVELVQRTAGDLDEAELAWCRANAARVRALMLVAGGRATTATGMAS